MSQEFSIDRSGLLPNKAYSPGPSESMKQGLSRQIEQLIKATGPISVAEYMVYALQHPTHGYYMREEKKIGREGDFVTAPEISQVFGELLGVWCVATWKAMGSPERVHLVEMGPGKGTLMRDFLRAAISFPHFREAITVHLVETSTELQAVQVEALGATAKETVVDTDKIETEDDSGIGPGGHIESIRTSSPCLSLPGGGDIYWHKKLEQVPDDGPLLLIGQEFLDALPVHQFQFTPHGWRERMVDLNLEEEIGGGGKEGD
ncbi:unnamed protein product, partial [Choristocarpus tenellus]